MFVVETCPNCGHDLQSLVVATYPPIPKKQCLSCGWSWTGERVEIIRVPFVGDDALLEEKAYTFSDGISIESEGLEDISSSIDILIKALRDYI